MKFFHRYNSTIHGNYRKAYLRSGLLLGLLLMLYLLVRWLMHNPASSPESYLSDGVLLVGVLLLTVYYRNSLPDRKATLKELMLFGMGTAVLASLLYGIFVWIFGALVPAQADLFTLTLRGEKALKEAPSHYWAAWWGIETGIKMMVLGGFGAFISALIFKNEKPEVKSKKTQ